jgi:hypothetical protein
VIDVMTRNPRDRNRFLPFVSIHKTKRSRGRLVIGQHIPLLSSLSAGLSQICVLLVLCACGWAGVCGEAPVGLSSSFGPTGPLDSRGAC